MASTVTYYRPGGVPGIYAVQVTLELQPSQWAKVDIGRYRDRGFHCGSCGHQHPINPLQTETQRIERYAEFRDIWERDTITIEIHEKALGEEGPYQITVFTASHTGIRVKSLPCTRHGRTWHQKELKFNHIDLIDAGTSPRTAPTQVLEERTQTREIKREYHQEKTQEIKSSIQTVNEVVPKHGGAGPAQVSGVYHVPNGFTATGLIALPDPGHVKQQQILLPLLPKKSPDQVAILN